MEAGNLVFPASFISYPNIYVPTCVLSVQQPDMEQPLNETQNGYPNTYSVVKDTTAAAAGL